MGVQPRLRDYLWTLLAGVVGGATATVVAGRLWVFSRIDPSVVGAVIGLVVTLLQAVIGYWIVAGSWRRTVWGCRMPELALVGTQVGPSCPRHGRRCARVGSP